ncbi:hypothetical protein ElyMa_005436600 [Elysia marginata]|uniref:Uncharacterized protein n=1 Tax=Elysia marginata TaxID=1093978 RepID=A0AAV4EMD4_9GAST|nr:hypothetical protein ElyMa_005436600 [Elysia marginata]
MGSTILTEHHKLQKIAISHCVQQCLQDLGAEDETLIGVKTCGDFQASNLLETMITDVTWVHLNTPGTEYISIISHHLNVKCRGPQAKG